MSARTALSLPHADRASRASARSAPLRGAPPTRRRRSRPARSRISRAAKSRSRAIRRPTCSRSRRSSSTAASSSCSRDNEKMRAEAMRRLGDLQVEVDEGARAAGVDASVERHGARRKRSSSTKVCWPSQPGLRAQRRGDVSAVARVRSAGAAGEGAGGARSAGREVSAAASGSPKRSSVAAKSCSAPAAIAMPRRAYDAVVTARAPTAASTSRACTSTAGRCSSRAAARRASLRSCRLLDRVLVERRQAARARFADASGARAERRRAARHGDHVLRSRRSRDARRGCSSSAAIRSTRTCCTKALGNLYIEKERYQDAALAYEAFAKRRPDDRYAPSLQMRTIEAYQKGGFASLVLEGKQAFVERYAFGSAFWREAHGRGCAGSCRAAEVEPEGSRRVLPRAGAEERRSPRTTRQRRAGIARCSIRSRRIRKRRRRATCWPKCCSSPDASPKRRASTSALRTTIRCTRSPPRPAMRR